jgi:hypothetical protein
VEYKERQELKGLKELKVRQALKVQFKGLKVQRDLQVI